MLAFLKLPPQLNNSLSVFKLRILFLVGIVWSSQAVLQSEHLQTVFGGDDDQQAKEVFAIPSGPRDSNEYIIFKVVALHPDRRSYLQRAFALSQDDPSSDKCSRVGVGMKCL